VASPDQARALLELTRALKESVESIDDPEREPLRVRVKQLQDLLESVQRRALSEASRSARGVGAAPRFARLR